MKNPTVIAISAIEANVYSPIHTSQNSKMYAILTAYDSALGATLDDVARTLRYVVSPQESIHPMDR